ncbi:MAG: tautomerase family protein [Devosia sp.]
MPVVQISMKAGRSEEQKRAIAKGITDFLVTQGSTRERVVILINDIPPTNYSIAGTTLADEMAAAPPK